mgnify:CR=1 FL=1
MHIKHYGKYAYMYIWPLVVVTISSDKRPSYYPTGREFSLDFEANSPNFIREFSQVLNLQFLRVVFPQLRYCLTWGEIGNKALRQGYLRIWLPYKKNIFRFNISA